MESSIITILSVLLGGALTFLTSYILEARKLQNEKYKFNLEKIISVGEEYYRFSGYALLKFENLIDDLKSPKKYTTIAAKAVITTVAENLDNLLKELAKNYLTITMADILYGVSGVEEATRLMKEIKHAQAGFMEKLDNLTDLDEKEATFEHLKNVIISQIELIKNDRLIIQNKISVLLKGK